VSSGVPPEIGGIGSSDTVLRVSPGFDPLKAQVGPDEYFVLSRIDGKQSLRQVLLSTGLAIERGIAIVGKLRSIGALLLPGESSAPIPASVPSRPSSPSTPRPGVATPARALTPARGVPIPPQMVAPPAKPVEGHIEIDLPNPSPAELVALSEHAEIDAEDRRLVLAMQRLVETRDPHMLLGVARGADAKTLKRAYFKLSKQIHPDRYYGKQLGSFAERLSDVFEAVSRAYAKLIGPEPSRATGAQPQVAAEQPQTPQEYASELYDRACALEVGGDALGAMKLFAAAVRMDPQIKYLRRAASCALAAGQPRSAVEYANKAQTQTPNDPSAARLLATAYRAAGRLADAEEVLIMAMALKSENDTLTSELRNDLAEVRRLIAAGEAR